MASNNFTTFTITQARVGEPLQFQPALGSKELEELVDAYVIGFATKQDKLSEVTLEFFNHAQVDIYTGLLTRHYNVAVSPWTHFESPTQSHSSGFSPVIFTPSPASSMTFADSGYGSISLTPTRNMGVPNRVAKKAKKDTKKTAEARLPGFSIMTKDGIDVTSSAGRGTKTKEQREHAHLMRIMKACVDCKRKKVRCDPSHRRSETDMSRSSTTSSSSRPNPSPPVSVPSLSRESTHAFPQELPSFGNNAIDDFVLFPEDNGSSWNSADMSLPEFDENLDLSQFNFDISGLNDFSPTNPSFDYFDRLSSSFLPDCSLDHERLGYNPRIADQYGLDQWASATGGDSVFHTRPHPSPQDSGLDQWASATGGDLIFHSRPHPSSPQDSGLDQWASATGGDSEFHTRPHPSSPQDCGQLDLGVFDGGFQSTESSTSQHAIPSPNAISSQGVGSFAENLASGSVSQEPLLSSVSLPSAEVDWRLLERRDSVSAVSYQNVGSSGSEPLQYQSGASSSGAIPGNVLENTAWYNSRITRSENVLNTAASYAVMFASLALLNYLQAALFILPLATVLLAVPHPTPATIAKLTLAVVLVQSLPFSTLLSGSKYLVSAGLLLVPLFRQLSNGSFGGVLSSSKRLSPLATSKDISLLSLFTELSIEHGLSAV